MHRPRFRFPFKLNIYIFYNVSNNRLDLLNNKRIEKNSKIWIMFINMYYLNKEKEI